MIKENQVYLYKQRNNNKYQQLEQELLDVIRNAVDCIQPGNRVIIKPNFVRQCSLNSDGWEHIITNPQLIEMVLKVTVLKLQNTGEIVILDAPQEDSDFNKIIRNTGLKKKIQKIQSTTNTPISCIDIRTERKKTINGVIVSRKKQRGDPEGYVHVNLKQSSCFSEKKSMDYYGADYNRKDAKGYHNELDNTYVISKTVLECDVFINMPKLKTHKIGGMTCCLKNAIGIIGIKNCIPHYTFGIPEIYGDAYPYINSSNKAENKIKDLALAMLNKNIPFVGYIVAFSKWILSPILGKPFTVIRNGHWYGNDTLWRAILDLNRILIYSDKYGKMHNEPQRKYISIIDGIVAGEKNGPMAANPKECGIVGISYNALLGDRVMAHIMGFDYKKIPSIVKGYELDSFMLNNGQRPEDVIVISNNAKWNNRITDIDIQSCFHFIPAAGWNGHIELT